MSLWGPSLCIFMPRPWSFSSTVGKETLLSNVLQKGNRKWLRLEVRGGERAYCKTSHVSCWWQHILFSFLYECHTARVILHTPNISDSISGSLDHRHHISCFLCLPQSFFCLFSSRCCLFLSRDALLHTASCLHWEQDKQCLCLTAKTFRRLSRFQHGAPISL